MTSPGEFKLKKTCFYDGNNCYLFDLNLEKIKLRKLMITMCL